MGGGFFLRGRARDDCFFPLFQFEDVQVVFFFEKPLEFFGKAPGEPGCNCQGMTADLVGMVGLRVLAKSSFTHQPVAVARPFSANLLSTGYQRSLPNYVLHA